MAINDPIELRWNKLELPKPPPTAEELKEQREMNQYYADWDNGIRRAVAKLYNSTGPIQGRYIRVSGPARNHPGDLTSRYYLHLLKFLDRLHYKDKVALFRGCRHYLDHPYVNNLYMTELRLFKVLYEKQLQQPYWNDTVRQRVKKMLLRLEALITLTDMRLQGCASWMIESLLEEKVREITKQLRRKRWQDKNLTGLTFKEILAMAEEES